MGNFVVSIQWEHETNRKPRDARSPSEDRGQALREGHAIDGSGCGSRLQCVIGISMAKCVEAWEQASSEASSRQDAQAFSPATDRVGRCLDARYTLLGVCARWLDWTVGAGHDPAIVRRRFSSGLCAAAAASVGLESAEARAASPRTQRSEHCPLAARHLAATKKRASNVKLAWFFSMKAAFCCNRRDDECGHREATRPFNVPGTDATALRQSPPSHVRPGRCGWECTTNFWITMRGLRISFDLSAMSMGISAVQSFWCGIACQLTAPPPDDSLRMADLGSRLNGFHPTRLSLILWRMFGISPNAAPWRTSFLRTFKICTPNWNTFWKPSGTSPIACIPSLTPPT
jgi:hypothetical protein